MTETPSGNETTRQSFSEWRRQAVYRSGEKFTRVVGDFFGRQSLVEDKPFLKNDNFPFLQMFSDNWEKIRDEVQVILKNREEIPAFQEVSPEQHLIAKGKSWRTFFLYGFGQKLQKNCAQAPFTTSLLEQVPNIEISWFSILAPGYHIPPHQGVTKGILRAHLGLIIPKQRENCTIRVDKEIRQWEPGKVFVLDDTFEHEVWNNTEEERVILIFDFDRPMKWRGRALLRFFIWAMKFTAFYQTPKKNLGDFEDRFEAATRQSNENMEKLADAAQEARESRKLH
ncbi:aspartyl/asparaginyl beta-hydroxylase domain-containing protein [Aestuariivirga litoralis]|uniref:aspartyl/asparaginyl beta-hydroxylase domain-containing protein n=1 Tax=Aestuariivirga litoralis TaxID=2650924 RepID=UPI0018C6DD7D|nr:aspartyl/asparaginyl beta-hydroxylase domain-containing protein [Aestuariivirga litoralis]MBG1231441.1 aspartyl/asparaginyl beta-hydroxylase domain-containing protein [Aestuariivirga litoralis]